MAPELDAKSNRRYLMKVVARRRKNRSLVAWRLVLPACLYAATASASLSGPLADKVADWLSIFILFALPPGGIYLFWMLHILPEKAAIKRHHPQKDAIHMLCLLSLVFGGLLWPIAMLWAYLKPMGMRVAVVEAEHLHPKPPEVAAEAIPLPAEAEEAAGGEPG
jgi:uncharacterized membrane protein YfcA